MNTDEILKKLEEVKVEAFNNYHSADSKSVIQLPSETEVELEEDVRGEDTKKEPILGEKEKVPESLSRTTPMAGPTKFNTPKEVYTSGEKKSITTESIQEQLDDLKKQLLNKNEGQVKLFADLTQTQRAATVKAFIALEAATSGQIKMVEVRAKSDEYEGRDPNMEPSITMGFLIENKVLNT